MTDDPSSSRDKSASGESGIAPKKSPARDKRNSRDRAASVGADRSEKKRVRRTTPRKEKPTKKRSTVRLVVEIVAIVVAAFAIAMLIQAFLFKPFTVHQESMEPTLVEGDRMLLNRMTYHFRDPKPGDVIVFHSPVVKGDDLVKRVIAVPGDIVSVKEGRLHVNGKAVVESYVKEQMIVVDHPEEEVPPDTVFVLGDNRNNSGDSRLFGAVHKDAIIGCAFVVYWPIGHWRGL